MPPEVTPLPKEVKRFARYLETERRASAHTTKGYLTDLGQYVAYLASVQGAIVPSSPMLVRGFLAHCAGSAGGTSLARKLSALRTFYKFLMREGVTDSNPA